jgi:pilus assembly protein Flp/PilA
MLDTIRDLLRDDDGATMVEYAIMVALIAAVCITIVGTLGQSVSNTFSSMNASL